MATKYKLGGKNVKVDGDGEIFVDRKSSGIWMWKSDSTRYSNKQGREQKDLKGMVLQDMLIFKGLIPRK